MDRLTVTLKTVTPLFLGGANPNDTAELRAPSIKGMMRFWWRAMNGNLSTEELCKEESRIFGGSGENQGKSKVIVKTVCNNIPLGKNLKRDYSIDCGFDQNQRTITGKHAGIGYLLYSTCLLQQRPYIKTPWDFKIVLQSFDEYALKQALASLWCLFNLGGLGTRARRGGGNIAVNGVEDKKGILKELGLEFIPRGNTSKDIADWLSSNFKKAKRIMVGDKSDFLSSYSNLSFSRFIISNKHWTSWIDALKEVGGIFKDFREKPEHKKDIFGTAVFGLPVRHTKMAVKASYKNETIERRSSPLIFKVLKVSEDYYWLVLRLAGEFLPEGGVIKADKKTQKPDYKLIDEFWSELKIDGVEKVLSIPYSLNKMVEDIKRDLDPHKIILYGSRARGDFYKRSDTDIAIETDKSIENLKRISALDIVNLKKIDEELKERIEREGIVLYERKG